MIDIMRGKGRIIAGRMSGYRTHQRHALDHHPRFWEALGFQVLFDIQCKFISYALFAPVNRAFLRCSQSDRFLVYSDELSLDTL